MITFKQFLRDDKEGPALYVFDIDETLFHTTATVRLLKDGKLVKALTSREYNDYTLKPGESFDFSEFGDAEKFRDESKPIHSMIQNLIRVHDKIKLNLTPDSKIIIDTGRGDFDDEDEFHATFQDHGIDIDDIPTHRAPHIPGPAPTEVKKLVFIRHYLDRGNYADAFMYDDTKANLSHFLSLKKEYPHIRFHAYIVKADGKATIFKS